MLLFFFFSSRRRHTRFDCDWSSDVCSSDLPVDGLEELEELVPGDLLEVLPGIASRHVEAQDSRAFLVVDVPDYRWDSIAGRKSTRLNSSHSQISYAVFCLKKKKLIYKQDTL